MGCRIKMTKKPFKVMTTAAMAAAFSASAIVPAAVMAAETPAEALSVTEYIVEKDGGLYSVDLETFLELKGADLALTAKYVKASNGKVYSLDNYLEAKSAVEGGTMTDALEILEEDEEAAEDVEYGEVVDGEDGPEFIDPEEPGDNEELAEAIEAAEAAIAELPAVEDLTLEDKDAVDAAQALVDAALELDENAEIEGLDTLAAAQDKIAELEEEAAEDLTVESVSAINSKTLEVTFSKEADVNAKDFSVKKGSVNVNVSNVVIAEDKKSAKVELASKLTEGEYTVAVKVGEEAVTGSVKAENEKLTDIKILTETAPLVEAQNGDKSVNVGIQALNQYGEDITKASSLTATATGSVVTTPPASISNNEVSVNLAAAVKTDDTFVLTVVDPTTGVVATKTIKVSDVAALATVEVGELYNKDGKTLTQDSDTGVDKFYLPVTLKDQYGKEVKNPSISDLVIAGVNTSIATVGASFETISIDGKDVQALPVTISGNALAGTTPVTVVVAATGASAQSTITVEEGKSIANITLGAPTNEVVAKGETINFPLTVVDNEGNEIKTLKELKALKASRGFDAPTLAKISEKDGILVYSSTNAPANSLTVVVQTENGKVATKTVAVREEAKVATIGSIDAKASTPLTTEFRSDDVTAKAFDKAKFVFQDQYGRTIANNSALLTNLTVKATVADDAKSPFDLTTPGEIKIKSDLTGITAKSDTVTFTAFDNSDEIKGSGFDVKFTIADVSELVPGSFTVEPVKTVYVDADDSYKVKGDEVDSDYATDKLVVKGKAKSGEVVTLQAGEYSVSARPDLGAEFFEDAEGKEIKEKTVDRIVTINQTGEEIKVPVTYSTDAPAIQVVKAYDAKDKEVTAVKVTATTAFDETALLATATFKSTNQYDVEEAFADSSVEKITFSVASGKATFTANGTKTAKVVTADEGSVVKATITTTNGKTITLDVTFEDGVVEPSAPVFSSSENVDTANDIATLGIEGTVAESDATKIATVSINDDGKIAITSEAEGTAVITVKDADTKQATIDVTVNADGSITLGTITKYENKADNTTISALANDKTVVSADAGIATVSNFTAGDAGAVTVTAVKPGTTTVTVTHDDDTTTVYDVTVSVTGAITVEHRVPGTQTIPTIDYNS